MGLFFEQDLKTYEIVQPQPSSLPPPNQGFPLVDALEFPKGSCAEQMYPIILHTHNGQAIRKGASKMEPQTRHLRITS